MTDDIMQVFIRGCECRYGRVYSVKVQLPGRANEEVSFLLDVKYTFPKCQR